MDNIVFCFGLLLLIYFAILWVGYLLFLLATFGVVVRRFKEAQLNHIISQFNQKPLLPITIIIPAYNESKRILHTITSILNSDYKNIHIIIVNDGSTDNTLSLLIDRYSLKPIPPAFKRKIITGEVRGYYRSTTIPNFMVIDKEHSPFANSGADCINAGVNVCKTPLYVSVDSDTILEPAALTCMLFVYLTHPHCVAIGGDIYIPDMSKVKDGKVLDANIPYNPIVGIQISEYLRSFLYGREGWSLIGGAMCHPGAVTMLETQLVRDVGGYDSSNFAYDAELIMKLHHWMRIHKYPYSVPYAPSAIVWCEEPSSLKQFWNQRSNWQRGLLRCLSRYKHMFLNPRYGITGLVAFPFYVLFEIFGPVVEALAYLGLLFVFFFRTVNGIALFWLILLAWGYMLFITMACVILSLMTYNKYRKKMDILRIFTLTLADMAFYRQYRSFCALFASIHYVIKRFLGAAQ